MHQPSKQNSSRDDSRKKQESFVDPGATSAETLADVEEKEKVENHSGEKRSPSPDGDFDADRSNRTDGSDSGGPM